MEVNKMIDISINEKSWKIKIDKNRRKYTNKKLEITL